MKERKRIVHLLIGPLLFGLFTALLPHGVFTTIESRAAIGTIMWMAYWWVTGPVDYAVTAFLPIALNAIFQMTDMSAVISKSIHQHFNIYNRSHGFHHSYTFIQIRTYG